MDLMRLCFQHAQHAWHSCGLSREKIASKLQTLWQVDVALFPFQRWCIIVFILQFTVRLGARKEYREKRKILRMSTSKLSQIFLLWSREHHIDVLLGSNPQSDKSAQHNKSAATTVKPQCQVKNVVLLIINKKTNVTVKVIYVTF